MSNADVFSQGFKNFERQMERQIGSAMTRLAKELLDDAVSHWIKNNDLNLTGNLVNSYASAVYKNGSVYTMWGVQDVGVLDAPTAKYAQPGDEIVVYPVRNYGNEVGEEYWADQDNYTVVRQYKKTKGYKFQYVSPGNGVRSAQQLLRGMHPQGMFSIVVCVGAPYASYLEGVRNLDVLTKSAERDNVKSIADGVFVKSQKL